MSAKDDLDSFDRGWERARDEAARTLKELGT